MTTYFLTVYAGDEPVEERVPFRDYADAVEACGKYYEPLSKGASLEFTSVVTQKRFMRSYAQLKLLDDLGPDVDRSSPVAWKAVKDGNAFLYSKSYGFLIESELGVEQAERWKDEDAEE